MAPTKEESEKAAAVVEEKRELEQEKGTVKEEKEESSQEKGTVKEEKEESSQEKGTPNQEKETTGQEKDTVEEVKDSSVQTEEESLKGSDEKQRVQEETIEVQNSTQEEEQSSDNKLEKSSPKVPRNILESSDNAWIVVGEKRRKNRSQSVSEDHLKRKSKPIKTEDTSRRQNIVTSKLTYKQVIQKSLPLKPTNPPSIEAPVVPTGVQEETPFLNIPTEPKNEPLPLNSYPLPDMLPSTLPSSSFSIDYTHSSLGLNPSSGFRESADYGLGYGGYYGYGPISNSLHDEWWPKTHYGQWREREMGLEREPWMDFSSFPEGDPIQYGSNPSYSSEELQVRVDRKYDE